MSTINIRVPDWLAARVREVAEKDNISVDQFVAAALAEKLSARKTTEYLERRAANGDRDRFLAALAKAPDVEPDPTDRFEP